VRRPARLATPVFLLAAPVLAQTTVAPTLVTSPSIQYPPIAKAAHVQGQVVVDFAIDSEGRTVSVETLSGPAMLRPNVENSIRQWRFQTPLPPTAQTHFEATYTFHLDEPTDSESEAGLDAPPYIPCCGDSISLLPTSQYRVTGEVQSLDHSQRIDVTPAPIEAPASNACPDENKAPPAETRLTDSIELHRRMCLSACFDYTVRVYRSGLVEWHGTKGVALLGDLQSGIPSTTADALFMQFQSPAFWSLCSAQPPEPDDQTDADDPEPDPQTEDIAATFADRHKTVSSFRSPGAGEAIVQFAWAIDRAADTHRLRHGDPIAEPFLNMRDDLQLPKPSVTPLIRAVWRFNPATGQQTAGLLKRLLAKGADPEAADESGWTPLLYAAFLDSYDLTSIELLLAARANPNHASPHGDTPLMLAAYNGDLSEALLAAGAEINAGNADGLTTLMLLAQRQNPERIGAALRAHADPNAQDNLGRTALDYLRAASCEKPILPLPTDFGPQPRPNQPPPCPSKTQYFLQSQAILESAMQSSKRLQAK
jgi:TonB family protein